MLHIRRQGQPLASWTARGWPPLLRRADSPDVPWLYWALNEVGAAADAHDVDAIDDLLTEAGILLERIWTQSAARTAGPRFAELLSISTALWSEIQRGRGMTELTQVALHARLLRNLVAPSGGQLLTRPAGAVPAYRAPDERVTGGHLPLITGPAGVTGRPAPEQFLTLLAMVLSNGGGHLSDHAAPRCPPGAEPSRTGWARRGCGPAGTRLGSIRVAEREHADDLLLRPGPCLTAVHRLVRVRPVVPEAAAWSVDDVGWTLAAAWLTDTTLIAGGDTITRAHTTTQPVLADQRPEQLWLLPLAVFHPRQFYPHPGRGRRRRGTVLRPLPGQ